jgi:hypothetical protein
VQTGGASASDEFAEITNVGAASVDLAGLELVYVTSTGSTVTRKASWTASTMLGSGRHLFIANTSGIYVGIADATYSGGFAATGGAIVLRAIGGAPVDAIGWGDATNTFVEGATAAAPAAGSSIERRPGGIDGNTTDTNSNSADWFSRPPRNPQSRRRRQCRHPLPRRHRAHRCSNGDPDADGRAVAIGRAHRHARGHPRANGQPGANGDSRTIDRTHCGTHGRANGRADTDPDPTAPTPTPEPPWHRRRRPARHPSRRRARHQRRTRDCPDPVRLDPRRASTTERHVGAHQRRLTTALGALESGRKAFIQDGQRVSPCYLDVAVTGGLPAGTLVTVTGTVDDRFAERTLRIAVADIEALGPQALPSAVAWLTGAIGETIEGSRVTVQGTTIGSSMELSMAWASWSTTAPGRSASSSAPRPSRAQPSRAARS